MILEIRDKQREYSLSKSNEEKKILGQYFTDSPIAEFMSSIIDIESLNPNRVRLLDCGAGHGMLTASTAFFLLKNGIHKIEATLYELDEKVIVYLKHVLKDIKSVFEREGKVFDYKIVNDDFVTLRPDLNEQLKFDVSVINPPYFKYSVKESVYSKKTLDLFKGDPNIYASFIAITLSAMDSKGQVIVISPRSFLNGLYFKGFRKYLLNNSRIDLVHIFNSRKDVFVDSDILQENIIFKMIKTNEPYSGITISTSNGLFDLHNSNRAIYPKDIIIDESNNEEIIRIPENEDDYRVLQRAEKLPSTFSEEGYFISTGPVVEFRTRQYLTNSHNGQKQVPLIRAHNVKIDGIVWDGTSNKDLSFNLKPNHDKHLSKNCRFLILKRFTSKDEPRRLVAGVYEPRGGIDYIGITNKLNYIGRKDDVLSSQEVLGLSILFNSEFMDKYYRCISGNTQVNATDIRIMRIPTRKQIIKLGKLMGEHVSLNHKIIEQTLKHILND